jgi:glycosyltransferase involved in cell wall biosynthesis
VSTAAEATWALPTTEALVSVIIPVYQGQDFIVGAVQSALRQTHRALEVWVVDDGSTDASLERLAAVADSRLFVLRQPNAGAAAARNAALARVRGRYVAFLDCDDRWFPDKIATELAILEDAPEPVAIAYSSHYAVDDRGRLLHAAPIQRHGGPAFDLLIDGEDFLMPSLCLFDRRVFDEIGTFNPRSYHEDHDFILRTVRHFPIYPTGRRLAVYRQTLRGRCRSILANYDAARRAELSLIDDLASVLSPTEADRLRENVVRSLYLRFLMYGFDEHARRLARDVDVRGLRGSVKGRLGWLHAKTGLNLMAPVRESVQTFHRAVRQGWWRRHLAHAGLELRYE